MATLQSLYCSVILQSLTFLKIIIMAAHQSKIWRLSVYVYTCA